MWRPSDGLVAGPKSPTVWHKNVSGDQKVERNCVSTEIFLIKIVTVWYKLALALMMEVASTSEMSVQFF
jgi:hypothetical protein